MQRKSSILKGLLAAFTLGILALVLVCSAIYLYLTPNLPPVDVLREAKLQVPLRIYSQNGELLGEFGEKLRTPIRMADVPEQFVQAILSAEDDRFLQHRGIDIGGLLRAASQLLQSGSIQSGGSTITMQVARNFFLSKEQTFLRKFNEILLALQIERELSKEDILELYVNKIYLGKRAYGIQAAASVYYGKNIDQLGLAELAMIAGLPKAPSAFNPINNPERARVRRDWILGRMYKLGHIDREAFKVASRQPVSARYHGPKLELDAAYAAELARVFALETLGRKAYTDGYKVITTIDGSLQRSANRASTQGLLAYDQRHGYRGPELHWEVTDQGEWQARLKRLSPIKDLVPAVITDIQLKTHATTHETNTNLVTSDITSNVSSNDIKSTGPLISVLLRSGVTVSFFWDKESNPLRPYINENRRRPAVKDITKILSIGDVIRIQTDKTTGQTKITQLPQASTALVSLKPHNGSIAAIVGGFDFKQSKFNRATQARRQPGSNFKPFIYAAALTNGYTAAHIINDAPIVFSDKQLEGDWRPENSSGKFYGPTTLRRALYLSRNLVSVRLLRELGIKKAIDYLNNFELGEEPLPRDLSLSLGSYAMAPIKVASTYATIANGGFKISPFLVSEIQDREQNTIFVANPAESCRDCDSLSSTRSNPSSAQALPEVDYEEAESLEQLLQQKEAETLQVQSIKPAQRVIAPRIMDERVAYIIDDILQDVIRRGTGTKAKELGRNDLAGKTGTTNGPTDAWFSGYHPDLVTTTWVGFDNNQLLGTREYGGSAALPIWIDFMRDALPNLVNKPRQRPAGVVALKIDRMTGLPSNSQSQQTLFESFREEYAPKSGGQQERENQHQNRQLDEELF